MLPLFESAVEISRSATVAAVEAVVGVAAVLAQEGAGGGEGVGGGVGGTQAGDETTQHGRAVKMGGVEERGWRWANEGEELSETQYEKVVIMELISLNLGQRSLEGEVGNLL